MFGPEGNRTYELTFISQNLRSIKSSYGKLRQAVAEEAPDIVLGQECWKVRTNYFLSGFHAPIWQERKTKTGGGVIAWIKANIRYERLIKAEIFMEEEYESMALKIGKQR